MRHPIMGYCCGILSLGCKLWMILKDHLSYFVTISQQYYIPITTGAWRSRSILTSSSWLLRESSKWLGVYRAYRSKLRGSKWSGVYRAYRNKLPRYFMGTLLIWVLYLFMIYCFSGVYILNAIQLQNIILWIFMVIFSIEIRK